MPTTPKNDDPDPEPQAINEPPLLPEPIKDTIIAYQEEITGEVTQNPHTPSLWAKTLDNTKEVGAYFAHEILDEVSEIVSVAPELVQEMHSFLPKSENAFNLIENYYDAVSRGHQFIDNAFATNHKYEQNRDTLWKKDFVQGEFPPPIGFGSKASKLKKLKKIAATSALTEQEILDSTKLHEQAKVYLKPYQGKYLPEHQVRKLITKQLLACKSRGSLGVDLKSTIILNRFPFLFINI